MTPDLLRHHKGGLYLLREHRTASTDHHAGTPLPLRLNGRHVTAATTDFIPAGQSYWLYSDALGDRHWARPDWMFLTPGRFTRLGEQDRSTAARQLVLRPFTGSTRDALLHLFTQGPAGPLAAHLIQAFACTPDSTPPGGTWSVHSEWTHPTRGALLLSNDHGLILCGHRCLLLGPDGPATTPSHLCTHLLPTRGTP